MKLAVWKSAPIAAPWRQSLCGGLAVFAGLAALWLPSLPGTPGTTSNAASIRVTTAAPQDAVAKRVSLVMPAFQVKRSQTTSAPRTLPQAVVSPTSLRMADGNDFPLVITIPAGPAWRDAFRIYGGAIGVADSSSSRPAYLSRTISPDGREEDGMPTIGQFLFRLSDEAIGVVNDTLAPAVRIAPGQAAFGVFAASFRRVVARVLQEFCTAEHVSPDDLAVVQLELGPGFGLRVASTTRRPKKF